MERPKRRRYKDNPYFLIYDEKENKYYVLFKDGQGVINNVEVSFAIYDVFNCSELHDLKEMNEYDNHIEHLELDEESIYERTKNKPIQIDDEVIRKSSYEELMLAIKQLSETQARRIKKYYFDEKTEYEIAKDEGVAQQVVNRSIKRGIKRLKQILKK
ncbi:MAG: sigma-70 family RNA polymerase sigma factor [Bacilli bacterium]|nr:sigma-70 family RNA polymerase sigma factor [Bacilli bacterium]